MLNKIFLGVFSLVLVSVSLSVPAANADDWHGNSWKGKYGYGHDYQSNRRLYNNSYNNNNYYGNRWAPNGSAYNGTNTNARVDNMQGRINTAIQNGLTSGRLTQFEANKLMRRQAEIDAMQARYNADSRMSFSERQRLNGKANQLQAQLWREMNDRNRMY